MSFIKILCPVVAQKGPELIIFLCHVYVLGVWGGVQKLILDIFHNTFSTLFLTLNLWPCLKLTHWTEYRIPGQQAPTVSLFWVPSTGNPGRLLSWLCTSMPEHLNSGNACLICVLATKHHVHWAMSLAPLCLFVVWFWECFCNLFYFCVELF